MDVKDIYVPFKFLPTPYYKIIKIIIPQYYNRNTFSGMCFSIPQTDITGWIYTFKQKESRNRINTYTVW